MLQLMVLQLGVHPEEQRGTSLKDLMKDPYILIAAGGNYIGYRCYTVSGKKTPQYSRHNFDKFRHRFVIFGKNRADTVRFSA